MSSVAQFLRSVGQSADCIWFCLLCARVCFFFGSVRFIVLPIASKKGHAFNGYNYDNFTLHMPYQPIPNGILMGYFVRSVGMAELVLFFYCLFSADLWHFIVFYVCVCV